MDWDDVCQDMADEAVAGIGGYVTASTVTWVLEANILSGTWVCAHAGPLGAAAGLVMGVILSVSEPLHGFFEEAADWWDMLAW